VTIQDLGSIGELVAAVATVATLVYLATQIRQNTRTVRASSINSNADNSTAMALAIGRDYETTKIYFAGLAGGANFDDVQQRQFEMLLGAYLRQLQQIAFLEEEGVASGTLTDEYQSQLAWLVTQPGFDSYWESWHVTAGPKLRDIVIRAKESASQDARV